MREHLKGVRWAIVDEIHELAADKRGAQLSIALERLSKIKGGNFQRIGLSATIGEEEKVARFLAGTNREIKVLKSSELKDFNVHIEYVTPTKCDYEIAHKFGIPPAAVGRVRRICELIEGHKSTLVFTNTREHAEALGSQIRAINSKLPVKVHHGSLSREIREEVEREFQKGLVKGIICTSSLELGIDIGTVDLTVQYRSPREVTRLVQRVGRSGHKIDAAARGCVIATWADDILESSVIVNRAKGEILEKVKIHENAFDVLAHQIVGMALSHGRIKVEEAYQTAVGAYPYRNLQPEEFTATLKQLESQKLIRMRDNLIQPAYPKAFRYYYENLSVIPDVKHYTVFDFIRKRKVGVLDQEFVARRRSPGAEFIMHGHSWKVISVNDADLSIEVEPTTPSLNAIPSWEGEIIPVDFSVAMELAGLEGLLPTS
jgi:ATP-dependent Lhr-like helicase